ncbi:hypothetical protein L2E82_13998 [Cichorium intybus]|uniref:Uncharacterized protein n=1 Tax=Cichorium intybus TaxID=13427 RepID=A0ACB9EZK1_CICIN|nr:hypothetical protein L2E82_13998 [Cichorium intybus]
MMVSWRVYQEDRNQTGWTNLRRLEGERWTAEEKKGGNDRRKEVPDERERDLVLLPKACLHLMPSDLILWTQ